MASPANLISEATSQPKSQPKSEPKTDLGSPLESPRVLTASQQADGWQASLRLCFKNKGDRTVLAGAEHRGPLRVQRPFYPEGAPCHIYLLHPPGGMVAGDNLLINLDCQPESQVLITTPAAGKLYRVADQASPQYQGVTASVAAGASLEWLPQETILFNGARGELLSRFDLAAESQLIGWDIVCLGRRASGERFEQGRVKQRIEIYRQGAPIFVDRVSFNGGSEMLSAPWGMATEVVSGTLFATLKPGFKPDLDTLRAELADSGSPDAGLASADHANAGRWGVTQRSGVLLVRYLGDSSESCRRGFERIWQQLRPQLLSRPVHRPRIWNT